MEDHIDLTPKENIIFGILIDVASHFSLQTKIRAAGRWVRDKLLGKDCDDMDIEITLDNLCGAEFCEYVTQYLSSYAGRTAHYAHIRSIHGNLETGKILWHRRWMVFSTGGPSMQFTINSMLYNIKDECVEDLTGRGLADLKSGRIGTSLPPKQTFLDDPVSVLRAIRFGARLGFELDEELKIAASDKDVVAAIQGKVSRKVIGHEIDLMVCGNHPVKAIGHVSELQLFSTVFSLPQPLVFEEDVGLDFMVSASKLMETIDCSFTVDQLRLCLYGALFLPIREKFYKQGKKVSPVVSYILCNSLNRKAKDAELVVKLHVAATRFRDLIPHIITLNDDDDDDDDSEFIEVDWDSYLMDDFASSKLSALVMCLLHGIKDYWRPALVLCVLLIFADSQSVPSSEFGKQKELYKTVEEWVIGKGLDNVWEVRPQFISAWSRVRVFKWDAKVVKENSDDEECTSAILVGLIRSTVVEALSSIPEVAAVPYSLPGVPGPAEPPDMQSMDVFTLDTMKQLPMLASVQNLNELARELLCNELYMKFGFLTVDLRGFCRKFVQNNPGHLLVMFFDLKMAQNALYHDWEDPEILLLKTEVKLNKAEEIEEYLKTCPGMFVERAGGMEEVKGRMEIDVFVGDEECPICLQKIALGEYSATTSCSHIFHHKCMSCWIQKGAEKLTCPLCRSSLVLGEYAYLRE